MPIRALVVDDEPAIREMLAEYLSGRGLDVALAEDGESAITRLARDPPDLLLTDLKLPGIDGVAVARAATDSRVPVVMMTGFGTVETAVAAHEAGVRDYLLKPFRLRDLWEALHRALAAASRERQRDWAAAAMKLLADADRAGPEDGGELLAALDRILASAPGVVEAAVLLTLPQDPDDAPLGLARSVRLRPAPSEAALVVRAVHAALVRIGA